MTSCLFLIVYSTNMKIYEVSVNDTNNLEYTYLNKYNRVADIKNSLQNNFQIVLRFFSIKAKKLFGKQKIRNSGLSLRARPLK